MAVATAHEVDTLAWAAVFGASAEDRGQARCAGWLDGNIRVLPGSGRLAAPPPGVLPLLSGSFKHHLGPLMPGTYSTPYSGR